LEKAEPASPYLVAFVSLMASAESFTLVTVRVGPKVSSVTAIELSGTPVRMVGCTSVPVTAPPVTTVPPLATASAM
jgi:hypothetical protein